LVQAAAARRLGFWRTRRSLAGGNCGDDPNLRAGYLRKNGVLQRRRRPD
jgi:hypothetical protein